MPIELTPVVPITLPEDQIVRVRIYLSTESLADTLTQPQDEIGTPFINPFHPRQAVYTEQQLFLETLAEQRIGFTLISQTWMLENTLIVEVRRADIEKVQQIAGVQSIEFVRLSRTDRDGTPQPGDRLPPLVPPGYDPETK